MQGGTPGGYQSLPPENILSEINSGYLMLKTMLFLLSNVSEENFIYERIIE